MTISDYLNRGADNTQTSRYLCNILNLTVRELTAIVQKERKEGKPICARMGENPGYFLAENKQEMQAYCRSLEHRERELHKTRLACQKTIDSLPDMTG